MVKMGEGSIRQEEVDFSRTLAPSIAQQLPVLPFMGFHQGGAQTSFTF